MQKFFHILSGLAVVIFLFVAVLLVIASIDIPGVSLDARTVLTSSMEPTIPTGSVVFIYPHEHYQEGDIVTFRRENSTLLIPITHRIIGTQTDEDGRTAFITKGDNNEYQDANLLYPEEIRGRVVLHVPLLGHVLAAAKTPWGFAALVLIPAALVISDEVKKIVGVVRRRKDETKEEGTNINQ
jgi:signal peptidase